MVRNVLLNIFDHGRRWFVGLAVVMVASLCSWNSSAADPQRHMNVLVEKMAAGRTVQTPVDWSFIDMEHSPYSVDRLGEIYKQFAALRGPDGRINSTPLVRIPVAYDEPYFFMVKQVLDMGGFGIVFPRVETAAQALRAVQAMRYPPQRGTKYPTPLGLRGCCGNTSLWGISIAEYFPRADLWPLNPDGDLVAIMMIETVLGVKNAREIMNTPGVTALMIGPSDLALSYGTGRVTYGNEPNAGVLSAEEEAGIASIVATCKAEKKVCGFATIGGEADAKKRLAQGFTFIMRSEATSGLSVHKP